MRKWVILSVIQMKLLISHVYYRPFFQWHRTRCVKRKLHYPLYILNRNRIVRLLHWSFMWIDLLLYRSVEKSAYCFPNWQKTENWDINLLEMQYNRLYPLLLRQLGKCIPHSDLILVGHVNCRSASAKYDAYFKDIRHRNWREIESSTCWTGV